jgi:cytoskeletal protein CcmA (bactofilin family)
MSHEEQNAGIVKIMRPWSVFWARLLPVVGLGLLLSVVVARPAAAAEFAASEDLYVLPQGEVIADDLYVVAPEIVINGTVEGDLLATGAYVEINGAVNGNLMAAAAGVQINGVVQRSARVAAMSVTVDGAVRKDLLATAGFGGPGIPEFPIPIQNRTLTPGIHLTRNSSVTGDAVLSGGSALAAGLVGGDLMTTLNRLVLSGRAEGDAHVRAATLEIQDTARVGGTLNYTTRDAVQVPEGVAATVVATQWEREDPTPSPPVNPFADFLWWLWRMAIQLVGLGLIAWLLWSFAPGLIRRPANAIEARPVEAALYGVVGLAIAAPLAMALVFLGVLFWGWFPGGTGFGAAAFGVLSIGWLLSPVITGLWVGRWLVQAAPDRAPRSDFQALLLGILAIVLVANVVGAVPCLGLVAERIIYVLSFALAVGGWALVRLRPAPAPQAAAA